MKNLEEKIHELFGGRSSGFVLQDGLGLAEGRFVLHDDIAFLRISLYNGTVDGKTLGEINRSALKSAALIDVMKKKGFSVIYEDVFSELVENIGKHEKGIVDLIGSFMTFVEEESVFMGKLGFDVEGYGTYRHGDLVLKRNKEMAFVVEHGGKEYLVRETRTVSLLGRESLWGDVRVPLKLFAGHSHDAFMSLPSEARDWALQRGKETGYRLIEEQYGKS